MRGFVKYLSRGIADHQRCRLEYERLAWRPTIYIYADTFRYDDSFGTYGVLRLLLLQYKLVVVIRILFKQILCFSCQ